MVLDKRQMKAKKMSHFLQFLDGMIEVSIDQGDAQDTVNNIVMMYDSPEFLKEALDNYIYEMSEN